MQGKKEAKSKRLYGSRAGHTCPSVHGTREARLVMPVFLLATRPALQNLAPDDNLYKICNTGGREVACLPLKPNVLHQAGRCALALLTRAKHPEMCLGDYLGMYPVLSVKHPAVQHQLQPTAL